jgi:hypothetical protein
MCAKIFVKSFPLTRAYDISLVRFASDAPSVASPAIAVFVLLLIVLNVSQSSLLGLVLSKPCWSWMTF